MKTCSLCLSSARSEIDEAIISGASVRDVAGRFATSRSAASRHRAHIPASLTKATHAKQIAEATTLLGRVEALIADFRDIALSAKQSRQWQPAVSALREVKGCLELLGKISGELRQESSVNVNLNARAGFDRMSASELEAYARDGTLPLWWESSNGRTH